jgi:hypothetical protein
MKKNRKMSRYGLGTTKLNSLTKKNEKEDEKEGGQNRTKRCTSTTKEPKGGQKHTLGVSDARCWSLEAAF